MSDTDTETDTANRKRKRSKHNQPRNRQKLPRRHFWGAPGAGGTGEGKNVDALFNVKLDVRVVLGHNRMSVSELLNLTRGSVIELDRKVGDPVDIMINDRLVARGDLVKIEGEMIGVALREIVKDFSPAD